MTFELAAQPNLIAEAFPLRVLIVPLFVLGGLLLAAVIASMFFMKDEKRSDAAVRWFDGGRLGTIAAVFSALALMLVSSTVENGSVEAARNGWMSSTYGVTAEQKEMKKLGFPQTQPEKDENFGVSSLRTDDGKEVAVQLAWQDDRFVLLDSYGKELKKVN